MTATVVSGYPHRMGGHCGSGALRDLMEWNRVGWEGPPGEGLVFTLGGSLAFTYVRSTSLVPPIYLVGRGSDMELDLVNRLGGHAEIHVTDDPQEGWRRVRNEILANRPVMAWADISELPYLRVRLRMSRHDIVIIGFDDDRQMTYVVDNDRADVQEVSYDALARARSSTGFPEPTRHATYSITWPTVTPDLRVAAADAMRSSARSMIDGGTGSILESEGGASSTGLAALNDFATDVRTWDEVFEPAALDVALRSLTAFIEKAGTGGGLFRRLLHEGSQDIARLLPHPTVDDLVTAAAASATAWTNVAAAASADSELPHRWRRTVEQVSQLLDVELRLSQALSAAADGLS